MESLLVPPGTGREARRQHRREAILDVAARSFLELGYAGTTMSAIAATLGGSKGTLWNYFPSKEELFAAVLDRATEAFQDELALILNARDPVEQALTGFCRHFLRKVTHPEAVALHRLVVGEAGRFPEIGRIFYARAPGVTCDSLSAWLTGAMARGELRPGDPRAAAMQITGLCLAGCHLQLILRVIEDVNEEVLEEDVQRIVVTIMRAWGH